MLDLVRAINQDNQNNLTKVFNEFQLMIGRVTAKPTPMVDSGGIGKPGNYKGDEAKYQEWKVKLKAYLRVSIPWGTDVGIRLQLP